MTRINVVSPDVLTDQHLLAEWRELPRVLKYATGEPAPAGPYRLGAGHVLFFRDKTGWLAARHAALTAELLSRGYSLTVRDPLQPVPCADVHYSPGPDDLDLNVARLDLRLRDGAGRKTHRGKPVSMDHYRRR